MTDGPLERLLSASLTTVAAALLVLPFVTGASAATTIDAASDGLNDGVFVAEGSGQDADALRAVVAEYADAERFVVAVFAAGLPAPIEDRANDLLGVVDADTVILFTPDDVAVASRLHSDAEINEAFEAAGPTALDRDAAVAARALAAVLTDEPTPLWAWLLGVAVVVGLVLAARLLLARRREQTTRERAFTEARATVRSRLQTVASRILELEDMVSLSEDDAATVELTNATGIYQDVLWSFDRATRTERLRPLHAKLDQAEEILNQLASRVG